MEYKVGQIVTMKDSRIALIMNKGIYENQFWCEIYYPDGIHLAAADYFSTEDFSCIVTDVNMIRCVKKNFVNTISVYSNRWGINLSDRLGVFAAPANQ